jgi:ankyrin repeat protein
MDIPQSSNEKQKLSADVWFMAIRDGNRVIIERYLGSGWDVNAQGEKYGRTALHLAAMNGHLEIVKLLLEHGADVNAKTEGGFYGETAVEMAEHKGHMKVFGFIRQWLEHKQNFDPNN